MDQAKKPWPWYVRVIFGKNPVVTVARAAVWATILVVVFRFVLQGISVRGESMEPTYHNGQIKFINKLAYVWNKPQRFDVVAVRAPGLKAAYLKRVVALPGERLTIRNGEILVNGQRLQEPFARDRTIVSSTDEVLEPNQYFVIGDNRQISDGWKKYDYQILGKLVY